MGVVVAVLVGSVAVAVVAGVGGGGGENKKMKCDNCGEEVDEVCGGGYCRKWHVSCSWEDCITGTFEARIHYNTLRQMGYNKKQAKESTLSIYPAAKLN